jgi:hypothetical protein
MQHDVFTRRSVPALLAGAATGTIGVLAGSDDAARAAHSPGKALLQEPKPIYTVKDLMELQKIAPPTSDARAIVVGNPDDPVNNGLFIWNPTSVSHTSSSSVTGADSAPEKGRWIRMSRECNINVQEFGAVADRTTDNTRVFNALIKAVSYSGGGIIAFPTGHYYIRDTIILLPGVSLSGLGSTLISKTTLTFIGSGLPGVIDQRGNLTSEGTASVVEDVAPGQSKIKVDNASKFAAGDLIWLHLGHSIDGPTPTITTYATIVSVEGKVLSLDYIFEHPVAIKSNPYSATKQIYKVTSHINENFFISDFIIDAIDGAYTEGGISLCAARNFSVRNITSIGANIGAGIVTTTYCSDGCIDTISVMQNKNTTNNGACGRGLGSACSRNIFFSNIFIRNCQRQSLFFETANSNIVLSCVSIETAIAAEGSILISTSGENNSVYIENITIKNSSKSCSIVVDAISSSKTIVKNMTYIGSFPFYGINPRNMKGQLRLNELTFDFDNLCEINLIETLEDGHYRFLHLPPGLISSYELYCSANVGSSISSVLIGHPDAFGADLSHSMKPGYAVSFHGPGFGTVVGTNSRADLLKSRNYIQIKASSRDVVPDVVVGVRAWIAPLIVDMIQLSAHEYRAIMRL